MQTNLNDEYSSHQRAEVIRAVVGTVIALTAVSLIFSVALIGARRAASTSHQAASGSTSSDNTVTLPTGTRMRVRMIDSVDSDKNRANDRFRGELEVDLRAADVLVAPRGTTVYGQLLTAESSGSRSGGELELDITEIKINGDLHSLMTSSKQVQGEQGRSIGGTAAKGAGAGGVAGAMLGGGLGFGARAGAIIGGVTGAKARGEKVSVPAGSIVDFTLEHPVSLPVAKQ
jgi:hypothetical protein